MELKMKYSHSRYYRSIHVLFIVVLISASALAENNTGGASGLTTEIPGIFLNSSYDSDNPVIHIGVLANRGSEIAFQEWGPTADYLSRTLAPTRFDIVPLNFNETTRVSENQSIAFVIANPSLYTYLEYYGLAQRVATMQVPGDPDPMPMFGGVIFTRSDNPDINELVDLKGKRFAAVDQSSLGGWQASQIEILGEGIDPETDFSSLNFTGTHDAVVFSVLNGDVDAGTVRSTQLERMAREGKIDLNQIKVLHDLKTQYPHYPYLISTHLYPEWPFAALSSTNKELSKKVAVALLMMNQDDPAAKASQGAGWAIPQDYSIVHELLRTLQLPPYNN